MMMMPFGDYRTNLFDIQVFWTGATLPDGNSHNVAEALPRLHDIRYRMVQRGVRAIPLQPEWCALRPNACDADV